MPLRHAIAQLADKDEVQHGHALADASKGVFVLADGRSSAGASQEASRIVCEKVAGAIQRNRAAGTDHSVVENALYAANTALYNLTGLADKDDALTSTGVVALFEAKRVTFGHVGNSRAYLYRAGRLRPATTDHTLALEQVREGVIDPLDNQLSRDRKVVLRVLGADDGVVADVSSFEVHDNDIILLCSDGLTDVLNDGQIQRVLERHGEDLEAAAEELTAQQNPEDSITVLLVQAHVEPGRGVLGTSLRPQRDAFPLSTLLIAVGVIVLVAVVVYVVVNLTTRSPAPPPDEPPPLAAVATTTPLPAATEVTTASPAARPDDDAPPTRPAAGPVLQLVQEIDQALNLPPEDRHAFLQEKTTGDWGPHFVQGTNLVLPFREDVTETVLRRQAWLGNRGADYLITILEPKTLGCYLAEIRKQGETWHVAINYAPPTPTPTITPTATNTRTATVPLSQRSPTPTETLPPPTPTREDREAFLRSLPSEQRTQYALKLFIEKDLAAMIRASTPTFLDPVLNAFSRDVAAKQYPFKLANTATSLQELLADYAAAGAAAKVKFLGTFGPRATQARARIRFAVRYRKNGNTLFDIHDVDLERIGSTYRIARVHDVFPRRTSIPDFAYHTPVPMSQE